MSLPRAVRIALVAVAGLAAGAAAWMGAAPVEPHLEVRAQLEVRMDYYEIWNVVAKARGGETIDEVGLEKATGPTELITFPIRGLRSGVTMVFRLKVEGVRTKDVAVDVVQTGRVSRRYRVPLVEPL
jgi:hypothetical protein